MTAAAQRVLVGQNVRVRPWVRTDAVAQELWPPYTEPLHSLWNLMRVDLNADYGGRMSITRYAWAVEDTLGRLIGRISLREVDDYAREARLGISLGAPYVGLGLGTEAMRVFLDYYFGEFGFERMVLDVAAFNQRAVRCYERLGFVYLDSDWRSAGNDPSLRLLSDPQYAPLTPFFRRGRFETFVEFYEMRLDRSVWIARRTGVS